MIHLLLVDDQSIVREGLASLLQTQLDLEYIDSILCSLDLRDRTQAAIFANKYLPRFLDNYD